MTANTITPTTQPATTPATLEEESSLSLCVSVGVASTLVDVVSTPAVVATDCKLAVVVVKELLQIASEGVSLAKTTVT